MPKPDCATLPLFLTKITEQKTRHLSQPPATCCYPANIKKTVAVKVIGTPSSINVITLISLERKGPIRINFTKAFYKKYCYNH